ncbi:MAG: twin-arginine translocase subunit TatC [Nitriliruptor sp.]|uniref:twin-arginine translocase subunit TatC n=1 Tax=Nitriliruptor sp. TaxID=2448056 RepID=UPI0034A09AA7
MTLLEHLHEVRSRVLRAAIALALGTVVGYLVFPAVLELLLDPFCRAQAVLRPELSDCNLVALRPLEAFSARMKTSVVIGLFVGGPVIFYQLWRFITPGLTRRERRLALPFVLLSQVMFAVGLVFAYVVIPQGLRILLGMAGDRVETFLSVEEYLSFFLTTSVAFGLVFELPLVLIFLSLVGVVSCASLRRARPYAMVAIVVVAAIITPTTDAITLLLMAGPMALFYELSILAAWVIERRRRRR